MQHPDLPQLNIAIALMSEAKPIIDHYRLKPVSAPGFSLYSGHFQCDCKQGQEQNTCRLNLIVSGLGRVAMATAVGWLAAYRPLAKTAWLNIGVAGHQNKPVGTAVRVIKCEQVIGDRSLFLPLVAPWVGEVANLITVDQPISDYPSSDLVDMEGAAFFRSATLFSPAELVQSIKVVSDNSQTGSTQLDAAQITTLIEQNKSEICDFSKALVALAGKLPVPSSAAVAFLESLSSLRTTVSQRAQLVDAAQKLISTGMTLEDLLKMGASVTSAGALIQSMQSRLQSSPPNLHG